MVEIERLTHEEAIRRALRDDPRAAGTILQADAGQTIVMTLVCRFEVPANYAKAVLEDYVRENANQ